MEATVSAAVFGVIAIVAISIIVGVLWTRKVKFARKAQPTLHHANTMGSLELDSVIMSYFASREFSAYLPKPPPRVHNPVRTTITFLHSKCHTRKEGIRRSSLQEPCGSQKDCLGRETEFTCTSPSPSHCTVNAPGIPGDAVGVRPGSSMTLSSPLYTVRSKMNTRNLGNPGLHDATQLIGHASGEAIQTKDYLSDPTSRMLSTPPASTSQIPSPPPTPTYSTTPVLSRHCLDLAATSKLPSRPPTLIGSSPPLCWSSPNLTIKAVAQEIDEEHKIWSDVFSLDDYGHEDQLIRAYSSASIRDQLPSPPLTPSVFAPSFPPTSSPSPTSTCVHLDQEGPHVWRSAVQSSKIATDREEPMSKDNIDGNGPVDFRGGLAAVALSSSWASTAAASLVTKVGIHLRDGMESKEDDSPPAYQSLGFDYASRLAHKRAFSPCADTTAPDKSTTRIFLHQVAAIVKPHPPLKEWKPLLCRKIDVSKLHARRFSGFPGHAILSKASSNQEPRDFKSQATTCKLVGTLRTPETWKEEPIDEETVMGLAV